MTLPLASGTKLGRYEIRAKIGAGGMGEVYLALDTDLDRTVAIKILPEALAAEPQRLQRFVQEAKAASALNHPHILTIHEIGTEAATRFIATEFIDGDTLRVRLNEGMKLSEILEVAIQTAGALAAAHDAGIIHRDIKPENIMVRRDGYVKVLDFGLAKLTEPAGASTDGEAPTRAKINTDAGTVMGTANYMSPEQAKGIHVDARTDLWSLGVVLYEMVARYLPFQGETPTETISLILQREPAPLSRYVEAAPAELERIVNKSLTKNRDERYQTARDFLIDLKNLKRRLEVDAEIDRSTPTGRVGAPPPSGPWSETVTLPPEGGIPNTRVSNTQQNARGIRRRRLAPAAIVAGLVILATAAGIIGWRASRSTSRNDGPIDSIAVLPFANASKDPNAEYLSDGITESLISTLSQLPSLKVTSRSAVFRYKDKEVDAQTAGSELKVRAILKGGVKQLADQLVISVELIDSSDNHQIWGDQYVRKFADVLAVQRDIVQEVSGKLRLKLSNAEQQKLARHSTDNPEAYRLYLLGKYSAVKMTPESFANGIKYLQQAIDLDPGYALAYSGLAFYYVQSLDQILPPKEAMPKSREAALKALTLDESLAEAHVSLAYVYWQYDWDWPRAQREFQRALELDPNNADTYGPYGFFLTLMGQFDQGLEAVTKAAEMNPLSLESGLYEAPSYYLARRYDEAINRAQKVIDMAPEFWLPHLIAGRAYEGKGQLSMALVEYQKARAADNSTSEILMDLGRAYGLAGQRTEAQRILQELNSRKKTGYVSPFQIAMVHIGLGEKDEAFAALDQALEARSWYMTWLKTAPEFDSLRSDPRFAGLSQRVGFAQ